MWESKQESEFKKPRAYKNISCTEMNLTKKNEKKSYCNIS